MRDSQLDMTPHDAAAAHLWWNDPTRPPYLYCILDGARDRRIYPKLRELSALGEEIEGLYQGKSAVDLASVAPYMICRGSRLTVFDWIWSAGWGRSWGIFFWSTTALAGLREHFRRHTMVNREGGGRMLFRFYDPRVLRTVLPVLEADQLKAFFGPSILRFSAESEDGAAILDYRLVGGALAITETRLS
jgi:hypothetical protein